MADELKIDDIELIDKTVSALSRNFNDTKSVEAQAATGAAIGQLLQAKALIASSFSFSAGSQYWSPQPGAGYQIFSCKP